MKPEGASDDDPGVDFPGFGPHSLRCANITGRQEAGGSANEASKIAGDANNKITEQYTFVQLKRQEELTRRVQDKRAKAAKKAKDKKVIEFKKETARMNVDRGRVRSRCRARGGQSRTTPGAGH